MSIDKKIMEKAHCYNNGEKTLDYRELIENNFDWLYGKKYRCGDHDNQKIFKVNGLVTCLYYKLGSCFVKK